MDITPEENTIGLNFIPLVLKRKDCRDHGVPVGIPCYHIFPAEGENVRAGICNRRAKRAGFNARISLSSLRKKPTPTTA